MWSGEQAAMPSGEYEMLARLDARVEEQEAALERGDLFQAALLAAMETTPWGNVANRVSSQNALWAETVQDHAVEVRRRLHQALDAAATFPVPATPGHPRGRRYPPVAPAAQTRCWSA